MIGRQLELGIDEDYLQIGVRLYWTLWNRAGWQVGLSLARWERFRGPWPKDGPFPVLHEWQLGPLWVKRFCP